MIGNQENPTILSGLKVYTPEGILNQGAVLIEGKKIQKIFSSPITEKNSLSFPESYHLLPGFIDLHVHGALGFDVMDGSQDALNAISQTLAKEGTTSFLATTMTAPEKEIEKALCNVRDFISTENKMGAEILGVHLEGPFLSAKKSGAQSEKNLLLPDVKYIEHWQKMSNDVIKLVTLAPELANSVPFIKYLKNRHIIASIGHTDATYDETCHAIHAGCTHATHLFNAMRSIHQREPGVVLAILLSDDVSAELILDGVHLHPVIVQLILKIKKEKMILVTDAMRAKCMRDGKYELGGQSVEVKKGVATLADGTLAGSTLTMSEALRNLLRFTDCTLLDAMRMTSENPAKTLNIFHRKGSIALGKEADLVVLDDDLNVVLTMSGGKIIYSK